MTKQTFLSHHRRSIFIFCIFVGAVLFEFLLIYWQRSSFRATITYTSVRGSHIAYYTRGEGNPLILLAGFGMTMQDWDPALLEKLAEKHTLIIFDYRGVGKSSGDISSLTEAQMTEDVIGLLDNLQIKKADFLGWSLGSFVGQLVAEKHPQRVNKLVLIATSPGSDQTIPSSDMISSSIQNNLSGSWENTYVPYLFPRSSAGQSAQHAYLDRLHRARGIGETPADTAEDIHIRLAQEQAFANIQDEQRRTQDLRSIVAPTLIISGQDDVLIVPQNDDIVASLIPHAKLLLLPGAGHGVLFQEVDKVSALIEHFL